MDLSFSFKLAQDNLQNEQSGTTITISDLYELLKKYCLIAFLLQNWLMNNSTYVIPNNKLNIEIEYFDEILVKQRVSNYKLKI